MKGEMAAIRTTLKRLHDRNTSLMHPCSITDLPATVNGDPLFSLQQVTTREVLDTLFVVDVKKPTEADLLDLCLPRLIVEPLTQLFFICPFYLKVLRLADNY